MADWIARSAVPKDFGRLVVNDGIVSIEPSGVHDQLWTQWLALPRYPTVIQPLRAGRLRYAAIDWTYRALTQPQIAARGIELAQTFEWLLRNSHAASAAWFANPLALYDLEGELRLAFVTASNAMPPESLRDFPHCDERGFVYVVGKLVLRMVAEPVVDPIASILRRATASQPDARFATLEELGESLRAAGATPRPRAIMRRPRRHWNQLERGLGLLAVGHHAEAREALLAAKVLAPGFDLFDQLKLPATPREISGETVHRDLDVARPATIVDPQVLRHAAPTEAVYPPARRVYATANGRVASSIIRSTAPPRAPPEDPIGDLLRARRYVEALAAIDAAGGDDHLRGKALLGLGRLDDARVAFDRACSVDPRRLEAMLLRREVDRAVFAARAAVGTAQPMRTSLPEHLAELRDVLVEGRAVDAIQMLRRPAYDEDTVAQLLLAELLCTDNRADDALAIYERLATPHLGRVRALLALDRPAEALIAAEQLIGSEDDALELRARALQALDRGDEADAQLAEYIRVVAQRSERRVRSL